VPHLPPPDIVLLGPRWNPRAPLRAQLIEDGFEVIATDTWPMMRRCLRPGSKPKLAIVDLQGLDDPAGVLRDLQRLMPPARVLVVSSLGTVPRTDIEQLGFHVVERPTTIERIGATVRAIIS
jgi:hypothetical protein